MDWGDWQARVDGVSKSQTWMTWLSTHTCTHWLQKWYVEMHWKNSRDAEMFRKKKTKTIKNSTIWSWPCFTWQISSYVALLVWVPWWKLVPPFYLAECPGKNGPFLSDTAWIKQGCRFSVTLPFERVVCFPSFWPWHEHITPQGQRKRCRASSGPAPHKRPAASTPTIWRVLNSCARNRPPWWRGHKQRPCERHPWHSVVKNPPANTGDTGSIPGWRKSHILRGH